MDQNELKAVFEEIIEDKIESLYLRLRLDFKNDLYKALNSLRGNSTQEIEGEQYLKSEQVCALLDISQRTLYRRRMAGDIPFVMKNGSYYFKLEEIKSYMEADYVESIHSRLKQKKTPGPKGNLRSFL